MRSTRVARTGGAALDRRSTRRADATPAAGGARRARLGCRAPYPRASRSRAHGDATRRATRASAASSDATVFDASSVECALDAGEGRDCCAYAVNLRAHTRVRAATDERDEPGLTLSDYMRLPVSQYVDVPLPLGATMARLGEGTVRTATASETRDETFELTIPGLKFFSLEVAPVITVRVRCLGDEETVETWHGRAWDEGVDGEAEVKAGRRPETRRAAMRGPCVLIEIISAKVEGKLVESLGLNDMFVNRGTTAFRWRSIGDGSLDGPALTRTGFVDDEDAASEKESEGACIMGWTDIGVGVDPPGPFAKVPKGVSQRVGDAVLGTTLRVLQSVFVGGLAQDYQRWAYDEEYRSERAKH